MNWKQKLAQLYAEANGLVEKNGKDGLSDAEEARWGELRGLIEEAKAKVAEQEAREAEATQWRAGHQQYSQGTGSVTNAAALEERARAAAAGLTPEQLRAGNAAGISLVRKTMADAILEHESWKRFKATGFSKGNRTDPVDVRSFFFKEERAGVNLDGLSPAEIRTLIYTGAFPSNPALIAPNRLPGIYTPDMPELNVRSAFLNLQTSSPVIQFFRELVFTNNAAFVSEAVATGSNSGTKPESALTFEADNAVAEVLAHWIPITNQTLEDEPQMRGIVEGRLNDGLRLTEDDALLNGTGVSPEIEGLLTVTGTQTADDTYFTTPGNEVENAGNRWEDFDRITRARRLVRLVGRARPSFILISPEDLERLVTITDNTGAYYSGSPFGDVALARIRGLQVIETEALDAGTFVVGDGRMAAVFDRMAAAVTTGWIDQQFVRNMITMLAEERLAFAVFRPAAFVIGEFAA